jgi:hypothetical protein
VATGAPNPTKVEQRPLLAGFPVEASGAGRGKNKVTAWGLVTVRAEDHVDCMSLVQAGPREGCEGCVGF